MIELKAVFTFRPHRSGVELLRKNGFDVSFYEGRRPDDEWLRRELSNADAVIVPPYQVINKVFLNYGNRVKIIVIHGSGYENVDLKACNERGICVANVPDAIAEAVAEHALALTLAVLRNTSLGDRYIRLGRWKSGAAPRECLTSSLYGKTIGIVGLGRIGSSVARIFRALGNEVIYWSRRLKPELEHALRIRYVPLDKLFREADIVVISLALTEETKGLINRDLIFSMKERSVLINISRGAIIDEEALIDALIKGRIKAGLDVYSKEPLPPDHPLIKLDNVVITPHIAGYTYEAMVQTSIDAAKYVVNYLVNNISPPTSLNMACRRR